MANDSGIDYDLLFRATDEYLRERIDWLKRERAEVEATRAQADAALAYIDDRLAWLLEYREDVAALEFGARKAGRL